MKYKQYEEQSKALREYIDYTGAIDDRIKAFKKDIGDKEQQVDKLQREYTSNFIGGSKADDSKIKDLKIEISYLKEQLQVIDESIQADSKIKELADNVLKEYRELKKVSKLDYQVEEEALKELEREYQVKRQELIDNRKNRLSELESKYIYSRRAAIPYMEELSKVERLEIEGEL